MFDLGDQLNGQSVSFDRCDAHRIDLLEQAACLADGHFLADSARRELGHRGVQAAAQRPY